MSHSHQRLGLVALVVGGLLVAACGGGTPAAAPSKSAATTKPFVIGAVLSYSGIYGVVGAPFEAGMKAAIDQVNEAGGILGRKVEFVVRDDGSDVNKTVLAVRDLLDNVKPDFLLPNTAGPLTVAALPVTTEQKLVTMDAGVGDTNHPDKWPYHFGLKNTKQIDVAAIGAALKTMPNVKKVAIVSTNDSVGLVFAQAVEDQYPKLGFTVTGKELFNAGPPDLTVQMQRLKQAGPDALAVHVTGKDVTTVANAVRDTNWTNVIVIGDNGAFNVVDLTQAVPAEVQARVFFPTFRGVLRDGATADSPFIKALLSHGPIQNLYVSEIAGDVVKMAAWAFNKAGSTDPDKVRAAYESVSKLSGNDLPQFVLYAGMNPGYSVTDHSIGQADLSQAFALGKVSALVNGTYQRVTNLTVPKP